MQHLQWNHAPHGYPMSLLPEGGYLAITDSLNNAVQARIQASLPLCDLGQVCRMMTAEFPVSGMLSVTLGLPEGLHRLE
jgi:hypothetical protein